MREASVQPSLNGFKEQVWSLKTAPKIKIFLCKVLSGAFSVTGLLACRGMKIEDSCQFCGMESESIIHVLFYCTDPRQIWALSDFPLPENGFNHAYVFSNVHHLLENIDNWEWSAQIRKIFPWILWRIWKNINLFFFEGKRFTSLETVEKIRSDVVEWFDAQVMESREDSRVVISHSISASINVNGERNAWKEPSFGWLKCNIGVSWSKKNRLAETAWVLRDEKGIVSLHSRRAFTNIRDRDEAKLIGSIWAIKSMISHKINKVIFGLDAAELVGALNRPQAWPSFRYHASELLSVLVGIPEWKMKLEGSTSNRGATLIAQSVTMDFRLQSYVASNHPSWLNGVFVSERVFSSV